MTAISATHIPGWEFNRLLSTNPFERRNSCLPASQLVEGAAAFWQFEQVFCTTESLEGERIGAEGLGSVTNQVFVEMHEEGVLETVDWQQLSQEGKDELAQVHHTLRDEVGDQVQGLIERSADSDLEALTEELLAPVLKEKRCVLAGSFAGLAYWSGPTNGPRARDGRSVAHRALREMAELPNAAVIRGRRGLQLLEPLESLLRPQDLVALEEARTTEAALIRSLKAGELSYDEYIWACARHSAAYRVGSDALARLWKQNRENLKRLRGLASEYLWPELHGTWLPLLARPSCDREAVQEFKRWLRRGVRWRAFAPLLRLRASQVFLGSVTVAGAVGPVAAFADQASAAGPIAASAAGLGTGAALASVGSRRLIGRSAPVASFYQMALRRRR